LECRCKGRGSARDAWLLIDFRDGLEVRKLAAVEKEELDEEEMDFLGA
jgi:hypothetical protein